MNLSCAAKFKSSNNSEDESEIAKSASRSECVVSSRIDDPALLVAEDLIEEGVEDKIEPTKLRVQIKNILNQPIILF